MRSTIRCSFSARSFVLAAVIFLGRDVVAADNSEDIAEFDVPKKGSAALVLAHFYLESKTRDHAKAQRVRALGNYAQTNYVLFRFL